MRSTSKLPLFYPTCVAAALLLIACGNGGGSSSGSAGSSSAGGSRGGTSSGGTSSAGSAGSGSAGSGKGGSNAAGTGGNDDAGGGEAGGSAGSVSHGGAPNVDYGNPEVPPAEWTNITGTFAGMQSECGNMAPVFSSPFVDLLVFGVARQGLWSSTDGGASYAKIGTTGDKILHRLSSVIFDPSSSEIFYTAGIYGWENPFTDGVFKTTDRGASFSGYKALSMIQSANDSISIDFGDPDRKTMLSGGHEQLDVLFMSQDAGASWTNIRASLPADLGFCTWALVLDKQRMLVACAASYSQKAGAIVRSSDGGDSWTKVSDKGAVWQPLWAEDGSIYFSAEAGGLLKSEDLGVTFSVVASGAPNRVAPIQLPDGRIVMFANKKLSASADGGKTWHDISSELPFDAAGLAYSPFRRAFYATYADCTNNVPQNAVARYGFDFKQ